MKITDTGLDVGVGEHVVAPVHLTEQVNGIKQNIAISQGDIVKTGILFEGEIYPIGGKDVVYNQADFSQGKITVNFSSDDTKDIPVVEKSDAQIIIWVKKLSENYSRVFLGNLKISQTYISKFQI
jgi:hypothetical protein